MNYNINDKVPKLRDMVNRFPGRKLPAPAIARELDTKAASPAVSTINNCGLGEYRWFLDDTSPTKCCSNSMTRLVGYSQRSGAGSKYAVRKVGTLLACDICGKVVADGKFSIVGTAADLVPVVTADNTLVGTQVPPKVSNEEIKSVVEEFLHSARKE
jgi:hypothetical protein